MNNLLNKSANSAEHARFLAVAEWQSGLWLQVLASPTVGTLLDNTTFRLSVCLRLGATCNLPHLCPYGEKLDSLGHHGLSCNRSAVISLGMQVLIISSIDCLEIADYRYANNSTNTLLTL
ncbi:unnamed protein product [Diatraea saccharalis]|uniref:Uncharacterized protein n=1 Tax=Diatraea saccharalis TaxID=40085 RepID=A0A9N9QYI4_9NEOP|nr:unnamed protein product [Diatraea saccharalis]